MVLSHMENGFSTLTVVISLSLSLSSSHTPSQGCTLFFTHSSALHWPHLLQHTHRGTETESNKHNTEILIQTPTQTHSDTGQYRQTGASMSSHYCSLSYYSILVCYCFTTLGNHFTDPFICLCSLCSTWPRTSQTSPLLQCQFTAMGLTQSRDLVNIWISD